MGCGASTRQKDDRQAFLIVPQVSEFSADEDEPEPPRDIRDFYVLGEVLGSGAFGQVRSACLIKDPSELRAVKVLEKDGNVCREDLDQEVELLGQLEHENIIRFHDVYEDMHFLYIVTDHCAGGEVFAKIVELRRFTEENAAFMGKQMLAAIAYLHDKRIVHRDVKAENFLLAEPTIHSKIKMIDFGLATRIEEGQFLTELCGSPHYVAPELIGQRYTELVDVWAFGVLMYLLMYGAYPYDGKDPKDIMIKVLTKKIPWQKRAVLSNTCLDCLTTALQHDVTKRLSAKEVSQHAWFDGSSEGNSIPSEVLRSAHRKVTASRRTADPSVEQQRNEKLQKLEEDWKQGLLPANIRPVHRPEVLRRKNRLRTAPSVGMKDSPAIALAHHLDLCRDLLSQADAKGFLESQNDSASIDLGCPGAEDLIDADFTTLTPRLPPGMIRSSQSFPDRDMIGSRVRAASEVLD
ncbi:CaMKI [Symbiodinium sp. CCMP2456]|nr:CaMKI [Symbiodinium sp. CCMP2456]